MQIAATKSDLKRQLQVGVSARLMEKVDATVIDGCALLWTVARERKQLTGRLHGTIVGPTGRSDWSVRLVG